MGLMNIMIQIVTSPPSFPWSLGQGVIRTVQGSSAPWLERMGHKVIGQDRSSFCRFTSFLQESMKIPSKVGALQRPHDRR